MDAMPRERIVGAYVQEARSELLRYLRMPSFVMPLLLFPTVFYLMFGVLLQSGPGPGRYMLACYSTFGVMGPGLFGFGVSLALERDGGLLTLKRALPMPTGAYLIGKMLMAVVAAAAIGMLLLALAISVAGVELSPRQVLGMLLLDVAGVVPFCALGMWLGTLVKGQGAPGFINLLYLPMAFLSGLWFPLPFMPAFLQHLAPLWPSYHLNALALSMVGATADSAAAWPHVLLLACTAVACTLLAARRLQRLC
jgi:ABC-2 type transport system permease protein